MKVFLIILLAYYIPAYSVTVWVLRVVMKPVYEAEKVPVPWGLHMKLLLIPFFGFWLSLAALVLDLANHNSNEERRRSKPKDDTED